MAKVSTVTLHDDLDGTPAEETVVFALDGVRYEIDLSGRNADRLRRAIAKFVDNARIVSPAAKTRQPYPADARHTKEELAEMRAWARQTGWSISDRGRIPVEVQRAFAEASEVRSVRKRRR